MTRNDIIRMARKAGYTGLNDPWLHELARKAYAAGAAAEREACAKACEDDPSKAGEWTEDAHTGGYYAEIIRARGKHDPQRHHQFGTPARQARAGAERRS